MQVSFTSFAKKGDSPSSLAVPVVGGGAFVEYDARSTGLTALNSGGRSSAFRSMASGLDGRTAREGATASAFLAMKSGAGRGVFRAAADGRESGGSLDDGGGSEATSIREVSAGGGAVGAINAVVAFVDANVSGGIGSAAIAGAARGGLTTSFAASSATISAEAGAHAANGGEGGGAGRTVKKDSETARGTMLAANVARPRRFMRSGSGDFGQNALDARGDGRATRHRDGAGQPGNAARDFQQDLRVTQTVVEVSDGGIVARRLGEVG